MTKTVETIQQLVAAREALGLSAADVATRLRFAPKQVAALEQGDWAALPGAAFARAALRGYGKLVGVDVAPLIAASRELCAPQELRATASLHEPMPRGGMLGFGSGGSGSRLAWAALIVLALVVLALFFANGDDRARMPSWLERGPAQPAPAASPAEPAPAPAPEPIAIPPIGREPAPALVGSPQPGAQPAPDASSAPSAAQPSARPPAARAPRPAAPALPQPIVEPAPESPAPQPAAPAPESR